MSLMFFYNPEPVFKRIPKDIPEILNSQNLISLCKPELEILLVL